MRAIATFAGSNPKTYLLGCLTLGFVLRLAICHGDMGLFLDPFYPLIHRG